MRVGNNQKVAASGVNVVGNNNTVTGNNNHVTGNNNKVYGNDNVVTGNSNRVQGDRNKMTGNSNKMNGTDNHSTGHNNKINGVAQASPSASGGRNVIRLGNMTIIGALGDASIMTFNNYPGSSVGTVIASGGSVAVAGASMSDQEFGKLLKKREREEEEFVECPLESEKDEEAKDGAPSCVICTSNVPACVIMPCMHKSLCCECARSLASQGTKKRGQVKCPVCRAEVEKIKKVFE